MAQNPDVMGYEGVKAAVAAIGGESLGGEVTDTGVSVVTADSLLAGAEAETEAGPSKTGGLRDSMRFWSGLQTSALPDSEP